MNSRRPVNLTSSAMHRSDKGRGDKNGFPGDSFHLDRISSIPGAKIRDLDHALSVAAATVYSFSYLVFW